MASSPSTRSILVMNIALLVATYGLLVFGASVRVHGAGLACPDWPLCFGEVIPEIDFGVALEFGHRVLAGIIGLVYLGLGIASWLRRDVVGPVVLRTWLLGAVVLIVQIVLGGLTVLELLAEWTVTSHLVVGNTFCMLIFVQAMLHAERERGWRRDPVGWPMRAFGVIFAGSLLWQLGLGGYVSSGYVGLACASWPSCNGDAWFPWLGFDPIGLQVLHRLSAYFLAVLALVGLGLTRGRGRVGLAAIGVGVAVLVQVIIGIANVLLRLPVEITLAHTAGAAALVLATAWLNVEAWRAPLPTATVAGRPAEAR